MKCYIFSDDDDNRLLRIEDAEPQCGEDFCDTCGDCLHCYGGDDCGGTEKRSHFWVKYEAEDAVKEKK